MNHIAQPVLVHKKFLICNKYKKKNRRGAASIKFYGYGDPLTIDRWRT
jgi:hypothetical protein